MFSVVYYTNNRIPEKVLNYCFPMLVEAVRKAGGQLVVVSWKPMPVEHNILWKTHLSCHENIYKQIMAGLRYAKHDKIFLAEHDVLYPSSHFELELQNQIAYNSNVYYLNEHGYFKVPNCKFLSTLVGSRTTIDRSIRKMIRELQQKGKVVWAEPEGIQIKGTDPIIDIRYGKNFTGMRSSSSYLDSIDYWGDKKRFEEMWN